MVRILGTTVLALALLGGVGFAGVSVWSAGQPDDAIEWTDYRSTRSGVAVRVDTFCRVEHREPRVEETPRRVVVTAMVERIDPWDVVGECPDPPRTPAVRVDLDNPLGQRRLYDGLCVEERGLAEECRRTRPRRH